MPIAINVPAGRWGVGVSGGADSVCLLALLRDQPGLDLHVVHLNHETRGRESDEDAALVASLAETWGLPCTVAKLSGIERAAAGNASERYRRARMRLFKREMEAHQLDGVILGHHADDQAETVFQRLLRGSGVNGLRGMRPRSTVQGVVILHPLLTISREALRGELVRRGISWREDESNASGKYLRNRVRKLVADSVGLSQAMLDLGATCAAYGEALDAAAPVLGETFRAAEIGGVPTVLARHAARRWLRERGADADDVNAASVERLRAMATDAASPARQDFPGGITVRRRQGVIFVDRSARGL